MIIKIRKFKEEDIPYKVSWINNENNNRYLHYDLPLREDKTLTWYNNIKDRKDRLDCTITYCDKPIGLIGLLNIDLIKKRAEYYICIGDINFKGKGVAYKASNILLDYAFKTLCLNEVYLYTEKDNIPAQKLFEKLGFKKVKLLEKNLFYNNRYIDRYYYSLNMRNFNY